MASTVLRFHDLQNSAHHELVLLVLLIRNIQHTLFFGARETAGITSAQDFETRYRHVADIAVESVSQMAAFYSLRGPSHRSAVYPLRSYARQLVATEFERLLDDAGFIGEVRNGPRWFMRECLSEWSRPPVNFPGGCLVLDHALLAGDIPAGPRNFPFLDDLGSSE